MLCLEFLERKRKERKILKKNSLSLFSLERKRSKKKIEASRKEKIEVSRVVNSIIFLHFPFSHFPPLSSNSKQSINFLKNPRIQLSGKGVYLDVRGSMGEWGPQIFQGSSERAPTDNTSNLVVRMDLYNIYNFHHSMR